METVAHHAKISGGQPKSAWPLALGSDEIHLWICADATHPRFDHQIGTLSRDEQKRARERRFDEDRRRFVGSRILLRRVLAHYLNSEPLRMEFELNDWGKPSLIQPVSSQEIFFSLSRSANVTLLGISKSEVGVDVEQQREIRADEAIVRRQFSPPEQKYVKQAPDRTAAFFEIWCAKEAYIKAIGRGLSHPLPDFSVAPDDRNPVRDWSLSHGALSLDWHLQSLQLPMDSYSAAFATQSPKPLSQLVQISSADLAN